MTTRSRTTYQNPTTQMPILTEDSTPTQVELNEMLSMHMEVLEVMVQHLMATIQQLLDQQMAPYPEQPEMRPLPRVSQPLASLRMPGASWTM